MNILNVILPVGFFCIAISFSALEAQTSAFSSYDSPGPYSEERISNTGPDGAYDVFRPKTLGSNGEKHAIITWGNGTGASVASYQGLLQHLATHGFVVIASQSSSTGSGIEMANGANWLLEENARNGSEYYNKLNSQKVGATGHSQGGAGTIQSLQHTGKITSIAPLAPATFTAPFFYSTSHVNAVMFIMVGSNDNLANPTSVRTTSWSSFGEKGIGLYGEIEGVTHFEEMGDCGKFRKYVTVWFDATLNTNPKALTMIFDSANGALHTTPSEWSRLLYQNLKLFSVETTIFLKPIAGAFPFKAMVENNNLVLQISDGKQLNISAYNLRGALVYNATFSKSHTLPFTIFGAKGGYITTVKNSERIILRKKMIITR